MKMTYVESEEYFTKSMKRILEDGETEKKVLFEHLTRRCFDSPKKGLHGFMILEDGSYYETKYKLKTDIDTALFFLRRKKFNENNHIKKIIFKSQNLADTINQFMKKHKKEFNSLSDFIIPPNLLIFDGCEDIVRIGDRIITGCNIFYSVPYKINEEKFKQKDPESQKTEKTFELLTVLYAEIQKIVNIEKLQNKCESS